MSCPDCGSTNAVDKATAWDAAVSVPPAAQREINRLELVEAMARHVLRSVHPGDSETVVVTIRITALETLATALGIDGWTPRKGRTG